MTSEYLNFLKEIKEEFTSKKMSKLTDLMISFIENDKIDNVEVFLSEMEITLGERTIPSKELQTNDQQKTIQMYIETKKYVRWRKLSKI